MTYERKLCTAKVILTGCVLFYSLVPLFIDIGGGCTGAPDWAARERLHLSRALITNLIAMPVLLMAIWSKLHGTGRSVRLVGFLGLAYTIGFFAATGQIGAEGHDPGCGHVILGLEGHLLVNAVLFILNFAAIVLTIRPPRAKE